MGQHVTHPTEGNTMTQVDINELLTGPEVAFLAGAKMATFERWRLRNQGTDKTFPEPDHYFGSIPTWSLDTVTSWLDATERKYDVKAWRKHRSAGGFRRKTPANAVSK
jgi:hypothetical protein